MAMDPMNKTELEIFYRECFPRVARMVAALGGDRDAARDIFHDALIIFLEKRSDGVDIKVSDQAYLAGIARICWIRKFNQEIKFESFGPGDENLTIPEDFYSFPETVYHSLPGHLLRAGRRCLELLQAFYYEKQSMQQVANRFHYGSPHSAAVQKHKCIEKIRKQFKHAEQHETSIAGD